MTAPRYATVSELRGAFEERGISPKRRLGQNFLIDLNLLRCVREAAELSPRDIVLEVGCGAGALTRLLGEGAGWVLAAEIDPELYQLAAASVSDIPNVRMFRGDAMEKSSLSPALRRELLSTLEDRPASHFKLVANLPYGVATAVMRSLVVEGPRPDLMAVTVQAEVARRLIAAPGTREYGLLSVLIQATGAVEILRELSPHVFWPAPKVSSALVRVRRKGRLPVDPIDLAGTTGKMMEHRRKRAAKALQLGLRTDSRAEAERILRRCDIDPDIRPDAVNVYEFVKLAAYLSGREP